MRTIQGDKCDKRTEYVEAAAAIAIERELAGFKARLATEGKLSAGDVCAILKTTAGVEHHFVQEIHASDRVQTAKDGGSHKPEGLTDRHEYRVGVFGYGKGQYAERTGPDLKNTTVEALTALRVNIPKELL